MTLDTRIALFLMGELVAALRANDPVLFSGGVQATSALMSASVLIIRSSRIAARWSLRILSRGPLIRS